MVGSKNDVKAAELANPVIMTLHYFKDIIIRLSKILALITMKVNNNEIFGDNIRLALRLKTFV